MEEEIDLRPYLEALLRNWMWIVGATVLAAVIALGVSSLLPPVYQATALIAVTQPREIVQFDPRFEALRTAQPIRVYPELATSDELLQALLAEVTPPVPGIDNLASLRGIVEAETGSDPSLLRLSVNLGDPNGASRLVNTWAELFVAKANAIYSNQNGDQVRFFESQLEKTSAELETAEQMLIAFQARNRLSIIDNELLALQETQAGYLNDQQALVLLRRDAQGLRDRLAEQPANRPAAFADQLTALLLQIQAFSMETTEPFQLQINAADSLTGESQAEQLAFLDNLVSTLDAREAQIGERLAELEPQILELQRQKQEAEAENDRLTRNRDVIQETYISLARKVEEERITSQDMMSGVQLASRAAVPTKPVGPRTIRNVAISAVLGLIIGIFVAFVLAWWYQTQNLSRPISSQQSVSSLSSSD